MKKRLFFSAALLVAGMALFSCTDDNKKPATDPNLDVSAPTSPQDKKVLVEIFTGNQCELCPNAHRMVNGLMTTYPGKVFCVNIHTSPAATAYTTDFSAELFTNAQSTGFPTSTVNRFYFRDITLDTLNEATAISYEYLGNAANRIMGQPADANIVAKAVIDTNERQLTVAVAVYYFGQDTVNATHKLNVALLEDSIWGEQAGGSVNNPTQYDFYLGRYCHMHTLRHLVTGQWGDDIVPYTGQQIIRNYTYTIPEQISDVDVVLSHLKVIAFVARSENDVINVCEAPIVIK